MASGSTAPFGGDHADLENVKSGQHHSAVSPDSTTITKNANGKLSVNRPSTIIFGDFEASFGSWSTSTGGSGSVSRSNNKASRGSYSVFIDYNDYGVSSNKIQRNIDLTNIPTLIVSYNVTQAGVDAPEKAPFRVLIGGNTEFYYRQTSGGWVEASIDVSGYTGSTSVSIQLHNDYSTSKMSAEVYVDNILAEIPNNDFNGAGN